MEKQSYFTFLEILATLIFIGVTSSALHLLFLEKKLIEDGTIRVRTIKKDTIDVRYIRKQQKKLFRWVQKNT